MDRRKMQENAILYELNRYFGDVRRQARAMNINLSLTKHIEIDILLKILNKIGVLKR